MGEIAANQHAQASQPVENSQAPVMGLMLGDMQDAERITSYQVPSLLMDRFSTEVSDFRDPERIFPWAQILRIPKPREPQGSMEDNISAYIWSLEGGSCPAGQQWEMQTRDQTWGNGGEGEEGMDWREEHPHTRTTICKTDSRREFAAA